jgi:hypothetical protein
MTPFAVKTQLSGNYYAQDSASSGGDYGKQKHAGEIV